MSDFESIQLTDEQQDFVNTALSGRNILVNACIGSGKTTAIQKLCNLIPQDKSILYLTYNRLLKLDAKKKITAKNATVTNYHGFAYKILRENGVCVGQGDQISVFLDLKLPIPHYDVLILDEYQDINKDISEELLYIKAKCPEIQIIAVGDMDQKIYDFTTLDVSAFIHTFLDDGNLYTMSFSNCFRLPAKFAAKLGNVWGKRINGVNPDCKIEYMNPDEAIRTINEYSPSDILCLGKNGGTKEQILNTLEREHPEKFNKKTVWASITEDGSQRVTEPDKKSAIFTTYDGSKGLERTLCVICDFDTAYWHVRSSCPQVHYEILRNIFLVAASRGKREIIFVTNRFGMLTMDTLKTPFPPNLRFKTPFEISSMFDFKRSEDLDRCFDLVDMSPIDQKDTNPINIKLSDAKIDISACVGEFAEASYFHGYNIDEQIKWIQNLKGGRRGAKHFLPIEPDCTLQEKILYLTYCETEQMRYITQAKKVFANEEQEQLVHDRIATILDRNEKVQTNCQIEASIYDGGDPVLQIFGRTDVIKNDIIYELKFVHDLQKTHVLQIACYMVALNKRHGILWNLYNNEMYSITIPNRKAFMDQVIRTITRGVYSAYHIAYAASAVPNRHISGLIARKQAAAHGRIDPSVERDSSAPKAYIKDLGNKETPETLPPAEEASCFAIIDTETTYMERLMSIGVIIVDKETFRIKGRYYGIVDQKYRDHGYYDQALYIISPTHTGSEYTILSNIGEILVKEGIQTICSYNAAFDKKHLPGFSHFEWVDIMKTAAYVQYNPLIPENMEKCGTGRLKTGYGVEGIMQIIKGKNYTETHNALCDAVDELTIMKAISTDLDTFIINSDKSSKEIANDYKAWKNGQMSISQICQKM